MVDPVKALGQVSTCTTTRLPDWTQASRGIDRIKDSPAEAKPVAVFDEAGVDPGLQHLQPCLRDQSICHRGNAPFALAPVGLGKHHFGYRAGPVRAHQQRWADLGSMGAYGGGHLSKAHAFGLGAQLAQLALLYRVGALGLLQPCRVACGACRCPSNSRVSCPAPAGFLCRPGRFWRTSVSTLPGWFRGKAPRNRSGVRAFCRVDKWRFFSGRWSAWRSRWVVPRNTLAAGVRPCTCLLSTPLIYQ